MSFTILTAIGPSGCHMSLGFFNNPLVYLNKILRSHWVRAWQGKEKLGTNVANVVDAYILNGGHAVISMAF